MLSVWVCRLALTWGLSSQLQLQYSDVSLPRLHFYYSIINLSPDYAGWADKIAGEMFDPQDGFYKIVRHAPLGVCAGIAPWNAPVLYAGLKMAPALAAGNTVCLIFCPSYSLTQLYVVLIQVIGKVATQRSASGPSCCCRWFPCRGSAIRQWRRSNRSTDRIRYDNCND